MILTDTHLRLGCLFERPLTDTGAAYTRYLSRLLDSPPHLLPQSGDKDEGSSLDLLLYWEPERPWWRRWLGLNPAYDVVNRTPASVLIVRQPHWPLHRILLILRADETDEAAIAWVRRLAPPACADVFVLPIIPPIPAMYRYGRIPLQAEVLLAPNTFSGAQIRRLVFLFDEWGIQGTLLLHDSEPEERIQWAVADSDCDLIILSDEPYSWLHRRLLGEMVRPLVQRADRSLLIARHSQSKMEAVA